MGWEVYPDGLRDLLVDLHETSGLPLYVTENGAAYDDQDPATGDELRCCYLKAHIAATAAARSLGADVRGYFAWSLLDNFEWAFGYTKHFGLVAVDMATQTRSRKGSADLYAALVAGHRAR